MPFGQVWGNVMVSAVNRMCCLAFVGALIGLFALGQARATSLCTHLPRVGWVSAEEVETRLGRAGFKLLRLRITNEACYAALVRNLRGQVFELKVHPATSQVIPFDPVETGAIRP